MRAVQSQDTAPELRVRAILRSIDSRYRLHAVNIPGKPDIVFRGRKIAIFVHGCFWHGHDCARGARVPKMNRVYWIEKIGRNQQRDREVLVKLRTRGWKPIVVWECELRNETKLKRRLRRLLGNTV